MAEWKKVIVSGSAAELASLSLDTALTVPNGGTGVTSITTNGIPYGNGTSALQVTSAAANSVLVTNGSNVPSLSTTLPTAVQGNITTVGTIGTGTWQGSAIQDTYIADNLTISGGTVNNTVIGGVTPAAGTFTSGSFVGINNTGNYASIGGNVVATGANSSLTGSFSGSFKGDGTNLTGVTATFPTTPLPAPTATTAYYVNDGVNKSLLHQGIVTTLAGGGLITDNVSMSIGAGTGITVNANDIEVKYGSTSGTAVQGNTTITITGTGNEVEITGTSAQALGGGPSYQIGLPSDVTIGNNLTVTNNAIVNGDLIVRGTASFEDVTNLEVADRFILLASGSAAAGDGGIVVQQAAGKTGAVFAFDGVTSARWGVDLAFNATASSYTPAAFMAAVVDIDAGQSDIAAYQKNGNIKVDSGDIYIYA